MSTTLSSRAPTLRPRAAAPRPRFRRAVTLVETVCAVAILSLIAGSMLSAVGYIYSAQNRDRQRLACAELANRLILQYLDDKTAMPAADAPIEYGHERFRWELHEDPVMMRPAVVETSPAKISPTNRLDRLLMVTLRVWLSEESGGSREPALGVPSVALWRFVDPIAFRNPDAINRLLSTDAGRRRLFEQMMGVPTAGAAGTKNLPAAGSPAAARPGTAKPATPAPVSGGAR